MKYQRSLHLGPRLLAQRPLEQKKKSQIRPCRLSTATGGSVHGVLRAGMPEGGGEVVEELLQIGVVLLVPLAGVERLCVSRSIGGRAAAELGAHRRCGGCRSGARKRNLVGR
jgi:hypothetical protein